MKLQNKYGNKMTKTNETPLKPCPCCPHSMVSSLQDPYEKWFVGCGACGMTTGHYDREDGAIKAWNTRHAPVIEPKFLFTAPEPTYSTSMTYMAATDGNHAVYDACGKMICEKYLKAGESMSADGVITETPLYTYPVHSITCKNVDGDLFTVEILDTFMAQYKDCARFLTSSETRLVIAETANNELESLGPECQKVLHDNAWNMYETTDNQGVDSDKETDGQFLERIGTNGQLWADEMHKRFPSIPVDELLTWCCNMIEIGRDAGQRDYIAKSRRVEVLETAFAACRQDNVDLSNENNILQEKYQAALTSITQDKSIYQSTVKEVFYLTAQCKKMEIIIEGQREALKSVLHDYRSAIEGAENECTIAICSGELKSAAAFARRDIKINQVKARLFKIEQALALTEKDK